MAEYNIEEVKELWRQEPDDKAILRAATKDIEEYPPEIQAVIKKEAERRRIANEAEKERQKKENVDKLSATIILQSFLESRV